MTKDAFPPNVPRDAVFIIPLQSSAVDYQGLLAEFRRLWRGVLADAGAALEALEISLCISSGTPQMKTAWLLLAQSGLLGSPRILEVSAPKYAPEDHPRQRCHLVDIGFINEEVSLHRIRDLLAAHLYGRASEELRNLRKATQDPTRDARLRPYASLLEAWAEWDCLNWREAAQLLRKAAADMERFEAPQICSLVHDQLETVDRLATEQDPAGTLVDIHHQARRRFAQGQYAECLARFWRVDEGVLHLLLDREGIHADNLQTSQPRTADAQTVLQTVRKGDRNFLDLKAADHAVVKLVPSYDKWKQKHVPIAGNQQIRTLLLGKSGTQGHDGLRKLRNDSVLGHGTRAVSRGQALSSLHVSDSLLQWLESHLQPARNHARASTVSREAYPFGGGVLNGGRARHIAIVSKALADM